MQLAAKQQELIPRTGQNYLLDFRDDLFDKASERNSYAKRWGQQGPLDWGGETSVRKTKGEHSHLRDLQEDKCCSHLILLQSGQHPVERMDRFEAHRNGAPDFNPQGVQRDMACLAQRNKIMNGLVIWFFWPGIRGEVANHMPTNCDKIVCKTPSLLNCFHTTFQPNDNGHSGSTDSDRAGR